VIGAGVGVVFAEVVFAIGTLGLASVAVAD